MDTVVFTNFGMVASAITTIGFAAHSVGVGTCDDASASLWHNAALVLL
jgi:hypothetical protein